MPRSGTISVRIQTVAAKTPTSRPPVRDGSGWPPRVADHTHHACTSAQAARTLACASAWRVRARQARHGRAAATCWWRAPSALRAPPAWLGGAGPPAAAATAPAAATPPRAPPGLAVHGVQPDSFRHDARRARGRCARLGDQPVHPRTAPAPAHHRHRHSAAPRTRTVPSPAGARTSGSMPPRASRAATARRARFADSSRHPPAGRRGPWGGIVPRGGRRACPWSISSAPSGRNRRAHDDGERGGEQQGRSAQPLAGCDCGTRSPSASATSTTDGHVHAQGVWAGAVQVFHGVDSILALMKKTGHGVGDVLPRW